MKRQKSLVRIWTILALLFALALCSTAEAQTKAVTLLDGPNLVYKGSAVNQAYYLSFPANTSHFTVQFDVSSGAASGTIQNIIAPADSTLFTGGASGPLFCLVNPQQTFSVPSALANITASAGVPTVVDCPAPPSQADVLSITQTNASVTWSISITVFTSPQSLLGNNVTDPCLSSSAIKSSVAIAVFASGTTQLVAVNANAQGIFVCSYSFTIDSVATTAHTAQLIQGTGATCSSPSSVTGAYGSGGITAGTPIVITQGSPLAPIYSKTLCLVVVGTSPNVNGVLTYVQM